MSEDTRNFVMVWVIIIAAIGLVIAKMEAEKSAMSQESIRQVQWVEVNPPPGIEGPCWGFYEDMIGVGESLAGVWCK